MALGTLLDRELNKFVESTSRQGTSVEVVSASVTYREHTSGSFTYYGVAAVGSSESNPVWRIFREEISTGTIIYADGNSNFDNVWSDRAGLSYS